MSNTFGDKLKVSIFGQSHSEAIGVTIDGLPAGYEIDLNKLKEFLARRAPGKDKLSTARKEADEPEFVSGIVNGKTCGAPVCAIIKNTNAHSYDYDNLRDVPRPAHADYTAYVKFSGYNDIAGGGQFSGRLTAPLCVAGGIVKQILEKKGIKIFSHIYAAAGIFDEPYLLTGPFTDVSKKEVPVIDDKKADEILKAVEAAKLSGDSVGGIIECAVTGVKAGYGSPMFDGVENIISRAVFAVPAVKGIEFGNGFGAAGLLGSENNDAFTYENGEVKTLTNNHGGILGGITSGMPIVFRAAVKPTPSISKEQRSVSLKRKEDVFLVVKGRHDPCIVKRAVPVIEAAAALAIYDIIES